MLLDAARGVCTQRSCEHDCVITGNSYKCVCKEGYFLAADGRSCKCGGALTGASGSFQTPGWPWSYPQENFKCEWIIRLPNCSRRIEYTIQSPYGISGRAPCSNDYIEFFDGINDSSTSLHKLCHFMNPGSITTSFSRARVVFVGNYNPHRPRSRVGVKVAYKTV